MAFLIGGANSAAADTGFDVDNSCRFNRGDSPDLAKSIGSNGSLVAWTYNVWVKIGVLGFAPLLWNYHSSGSQKLTWNSDGTIHFYNMRAGESPQEPELITSAKYRDPSAWYNIHAVWDSANGTAGDRARLYVNGTRVTAFGTASNPQEDSEGGMLNYDTGATEINISTKPYGSAAFWDGYMASAILCDGQTYEPTKFGEFDEDSPTIWKPIDPEAQSLNFGTHGFWLDFQASDNLGNDANGGTDFTETNIAATDSSTDTPTNNFNIMLPIMKQASNLTFSEGNLAVAWPSSGTWRTIYSSMMPTAGKWYWEVKVTASADRFIGIVGEAGVDNTDDSSISAPASAYSMKEDGNLYTGGVAKAGGVATTTNDIVGVAMDLDNGTLWFSKNGVWTNSATQAEVVAGTTTNAAYSSISVGAGYPYGPASTGKESASFSFNFGSAPYAISSGNADDNSYGDFEYDVPTGFYALCTKNLAEYG